MKEDKISCFIELVSGRNKLQKKYLKKWEINEKEKEDLANVLNFFVEKCHYTMEFLADAYCFVNNMVMSEHRYFLKYGTYRNSTFHEVNAQVYQNEDYMTKYMCGLMISDYVWINHMKQLRYFEDSLDQFAGREYLEIGPGFGQYFIKAIQRERFDKYLAVDISPVSVKRSREYLEYCGIQMRKGQVDIVQRDFFEFATKERFDGIVMGEVLEHVEEPLEMLQKLYSLLVKDGLAFITTVVNAPTIDHIYYFSSVQEVLEMVQRAGFVIKDYRCFAAGDVSLERAEKFKMAVNVAMILGKESIPHQG